MSRSSREQHQHILPQILSALRYELNTGIVIYGMLFANTKAKKKCVVDVKNRFKKKGEKC